MFDVILGAILGAILGFVVAYYYAYLLRVVIGNKPKYKAFYLDTSSGEVLDESSKDINDNHELFRFVVCQDKLKDHLFFKFTTYKYAPNKVHIHLNKTFSFHYYDFSDQHKEYFIVLWKNREVKKILDEIFFKPRNNDYTGESHGSSNSIDVKELLGLNKQTTYLGNG